MHGKWGVLLLSVGSPDEPSPKAVRRFLKEFLRDPRVVRYNRFAWWLLRHLVVLNLRPRRAARAYRAVWTDEGSPLLAVSRRQARALSAELAARGVDAEVEPGMRYGSPSIGEGLSRLRQAGCENLLLFPLFPQAAGPTTLSAFDGVKQALSGMGWSPRLVRVEGYHDHEGYIDALAGSIRGAWDRQSRPERLLFSYHGMPVRYQEAADYRRRCEAVSRAVADRLGLPDEQWGVSFQSRFGPGEWLKPYTDETLARWGGEGGSLDVVCPGFSADCLETLWEIAIRGREAFVAAGGGRFRYTPALNDRADHIALLADIALTHIRLGSNASAGPQEQRADAGRATPRQSPQN